MRNIIFAMLAIAVLGCAGKQMEQTPVTLEFRVGESSPSEGFTEMVVWGTDQTVYLSEQVALTHRDVESASASEGTSGPQIEVLFTEAGAQKLAEVTRKGLMKPLGIVIDGRLVSAPVVKAEISGGRAVITGSFSEEEAKHLAAGITAGTR